MNFNELLGPIENSTPLHLQKAVLWGPESLLTDSVEFFLKAAAAWDVVKIPSECGVGHLVQQVKTSRCKVIILCQEKEEIDTSLLMELSQVQSCQKVVVVNQESNLMQIYGRHNIVMRDVSDLLSVIDHESFPNTQPNEEVHITK